MFRALIVAVAVAAAAIGAASPASADPYRSLRDLIPGGYDERSCYPSVLYPGQLAALECWRNTLPGGPEWAHYALNPDQDTLTNSFKGWLNRLTDQDAIVSCPAGLPSPGLWQQTGAPNEPVGQIVCGVYQGEFELIWTRDRDLFLGAVSPHQPASQTDVANLVDWWRQHGTVARESNPPPVTP